MREQSRGTLFVLAVMTALLGLVACGSGSDDPVTGGEAEPDPITPRIIEIVASEFAFDPAELTLQPGEVITLRLRNDGEDVHSLTIRDLDVSIQVQPGETAEQTFTVAAEGADFKFFCSIPGHIEKGMEGQISLETS